jgi:quercetin dioxygenase-like cupin family protein
MSASQTTHSAPLAAAPGNAPDVHVDPVHRVSYHFEREGEDLWVHTAMEPGAHLPEHFHPAVEEHWEALDGTVRLKLDGNWRELRAGEGPAPVGRNVKHELKNETGAVVHLRTRVTPAGHLEEFLTESARAAREGLYNARNLPTSLRGVGWIARFALQHRDETVMTSPPPALQRMLLPLAARIGREG